MNRRLLPIACCVLIAAQTTPAAWAASQPDLNFKIYSPPDSSAQAPAASSDSSTAGSSDSMWSSGSSDSAPASSDSKLQAETPATDNSPTATTPSTDTAASSTDTPAADTAESKSDKVLKGYIRVVPSGTKVPIIMDTAVDSDTSQEGDEFAARTSEDLNIDGTTIVPAGSVIKGRIAGLNAPKNLGRSGSVALKFDTVTTPDNRQIPLVANLVARGGVVHARRGLKDIAMDTGTLALPTVLGLGIGVLAGNSANSDNSKISKGSGALIGAGVGVAIGVAILAIKKGKKVDVRPGDELKIELAEDLRMPM